MRAAVFLSLPLAAFALPSFWSPDSNVFRRGDKVPYSVDQGCKADSARYEKVLFGMWEVENITRAVVRAWWDEGKHREAAATYLALPADLDYATSDDAKLAHANLERMTHLFNGVPFLANYVHWFCTDDGKGWCINDEHDEGRAVVAATVGNEVVLCSRFWLESTTAEKYDTYKDLPKKYITMKGLGGVDVKTLMHELMHTDLIAEDRPHIIDQEWNGNRVYGSDRIHDWVANYKARTSTVLNNADSYAIFLMAAYWETRFGFLPPPDQLSPYHDKKECYPNDSFDYFFRDDGRAHVEEFCNEAAAKYKMGTTSSFDKNFNIGTAEETAWTFGWKSNGIQDGEAVLDKCLAVMAELIDGCDTDSATWKHGGGFTWATDPGSPDAEYSFSVRAQKERNWPIGAKKGKCDVWYKFPFYDEFYIYGGGFAGGDFGQNALLPNLRRCGPVHEWRFDYYPEIQDDGMEWSAYGRLPVGAQQWDCVRRAMVDSGSQGDIGCGGS